MEIGHRWYGRVLSLFVGHLLLALGAIGEGADYRGGSARVGFSLSAVTVG